MNSVIKHLTDQLALLSNPALTGDKLNEAIALAKTVNSVAKEITASQRLTLDVVLAVHSKANLELPEELCAITKK